MPKTKAQLRAEAVERLRELNAYVDGPESIVDKLAYGLSTDRFNYHVEIEHIIDLLADDCGPCYSCSKLAELMAENSQLRVANDELRAELNTVELDNEFLRSEKGITAERADSNDGDAHSKAQSKDAPMLSDLFGILSDEHSTTSESGQREPERDSREKLEADRYESIADLLKQADNVSDEGLAYFSKWHLPSVISMLHDYEDEKLMRDVDCEMQVALATEELQAKVDELTAERDELKRRVSQLDGDLEGARTSRDHWRDVAGKHGTEIQRLRAELKDAQEYGMIWPRFRDGALVKPFDKVRGFDDLGVQKFIYTTSANGSWQLQDAEGNMLNVFPMADGLNRVSRPPLRGADGQPIEEGTLLYGGDGRAWLVESIDHADKYPIEGSCDGEFKRLKPEWLTHEKPDSPESVARDVRALVSPYPDEHCTTVEDADLLALADRIEKLAKGANGWKEGT